MTVVGIYLLGWSPLIVWAALAGIMHGLGGYRA
jgi:hypothetical protein